VFSSSILTGKSFGDSRFFEGLATEIIPSLEDYFPEEVYFLRGNRMRGIGIF